MFVPCRDLRLPAALNIVLAGVAMVNTKNEPQYDPELGVDPQLYKLKQEDVV
jgi:hypothetical protein